MPTKTKIGSIIGVIILGAIGSGVWEFLLKSVLIGSKEYVLKIITFNLNYFQTLIYLEIAKGLHNGNAIKNYTLLYAIFVFMIMTYLLIVSTYRDIINDGRLTRSVITGEQEKLIEPGTRLAGYNVMNRLTANKLFALMLGKNPLTRAMNWFIYWAIALFVFFTFNSIRLIYINDSIVYFKQLHTIVLPYIDETSSNQILSEFAQIEDKKDFLKIVNRLQEVAQKHGLRYQTYSVW